MGQRYLSMDILALHEAADNRKPVTGNLVLAIMAAIIAFLALICIWSKYLEIGEIVKVRLC